MKDYQSIWIKWEAFLKQDSNEKKAFLDSLNIEVKKGFDVIVRIASEELAHQTKASLKEHSLDIELSLSTLVFGGYVLFLIENAIDPNEKNLIESSKTSELGNYWMESFEADRGAQLIGSIDMITALILQTQSGSQLQALLNSNKKLFEESYKNVRILQLYLLWCIQQGYILGKIENELNS